MDKRAIIFDMDGVIVDTEFLDFKILKAFIASENQEIIDHGDPRYGILVGRSYDDLYRTINSFLKNEQPLERLKAKFQEFNADMYQQANYLQLFRKDITTILEYAREHSIKLAVASSSEYQHILEVLNACGIVDYFDVIYSGEFVKESKPHPEIYQNTLLKLDVRSENAVAIEDSFYGITAAQSAGITTIAYKESRMPIDQSKADHQGSDMKEIKEIISRIFSD